MKGARCTNYGECSVADSGKRYDGDLCPECKRPAPVPAPRKLTPGGLTAIIVLSVLVGVATIGGVGFWCVWNWWRAQAGEIAQDENAPLEKTKTWSWPWQKDKGTSPAESLPGEESEVRGSRRFEGMPEEMTPPKWWQKWWGLPSDGDMKQALQKQVKPSVRIRSLKLVALRKLDGGSYALEYEVNARVEKAVYAVPSAPATVPADWKLKPDEAELFKEVIRSPNLRPGDSYNWGKKRLVEDTKESTVFTWNVGEARKIRGRWVPLTWAPFLLEKHPMNPGGG